MQVHSIIYYEQSREPQKTMQATMVILVPELWMMTTYEAHDVGFVKLAPSNLMDPCEAQGSNDVTPKGIYNINDDPAQGSNNIGTSIHGTVQLHTLVFLSPFQFSEVVIS